LNYSALTPADLAILCFKTTDEGAWAEFVRRFHPLIARVAIRVAREWGENSTQAIDDLIQETYLKLYENRGKFVEKFKPIHPDAIFGYIKVFTANLVHDRFKATHSQKRGSQLTASLDPADEVKFQSKESVRCGSPDLDRTVLIGQIESCLQSIAPGEDGRRDRQIFWLYYRSGLTANAIASIPAVGLTTSGVESALLKLTRLVKAALAPTSFRQEQQKDVAPDQKGFRQAESF
jgi:RNA polymerase sigma-70 factor (ECF subfamily)